MDGYRRLTANLTIWQQKGKNLQISAFLPDLSRPAFNTNAKLRGFELELAATPIDSLNLTAAIGYTDTICAGGGAAAAIAGVCRFTATCTGGVDLESVSKVNAALTGTWIFLSRSKVRCWPKLLWDKFRRLTEMGPQTTLKLSHCGQQCTVKADIESARLRATSSQVLTVW